MYAKKGATTPSRKPKVATLYLYASSSKLVDEQILAKELFQIADQASMRAIKDWASLAKAINQYSTIEKLVLSFHGYGGGLIVGNRARDLDETAVKKLFRTTTNSTRIREIHFLGCNIGNRPASLAAFGQRFSALTVTGYTWFIVRQRVTVRTGSSELSEVRQALRPYKDFIIPRFNEKSHKPNKVMRFLIVYGASQYKTATFPLSFGDARDFKPLNQAVERQLGLKEVEFVQEELRGSPIVSFQRMVVNLR